MKNTGLLLKHRRESSNLSLGEVAFATKINPKILNAIESGDESALPARTFLKGFIRSYALYLKMDVDEVMRSFHEESGSPSVTPNLEVEVNNKPENDTVTTGRRRVDASENQSGIRVIAVILIVVLIGLIIGVRELVEKYQKEKIVEMPIDLKVSPLVNPSPVVLDKANSPGIEKPEVAQVAPPPSDKPIETKTSNEQADAPKTDLKTTDEPKSPEAAKEEVAQIQTETVGASEIILEALDRVEVKFDFKGQTKSLSLAPAQVHTIRSEQPLTLNFSDGGAVNIILNGRERGVPGELGKPKTIKIP